MRICYMSNGEHPGNMMLGDVLRNLAIHGDRFYEYKMVERALRMTGFFVGNHSDGQFVILNEDHVKRHFFPPHPLTTQVMP